MYILTISLSMKYWHPELRTVQESHRNNILYVKTSYVLLMFPFSIVLSLKWKGIYIKAHAESTLYTMTAIAIQRNGIIAGSALQKIVSDCWKKKKQKKQEAPKQLAVRHGTTHKLMLQACSKCGSVCVCYRWFSNLWPVCKTSNQIFSWLARFKTSSVYKSKKVGQ